TVSFTTEDLVDGDDISYLYDALFNNPNVGIDKPVTVTGNVVTLGGPDGGNYTLVLDPSLLNDLLADITAATLTLTITGDFTADNKVYDGTTSAIIVDNNLVLLEGLVPVDTGNVELNAVATFLDRNAGTGKTVVLTDSTLTGVNASNYVIDFTGAPTTTADITPKDVTLTADPVSKGYDGTTAYTTQSGALSALTDQLGVSGDTVSTATIAYTDKNAGAGNKTVTLSG